jgi:CRP/FNR family transcriptional regulator
MPQNVVEILQECPLFADVGPTGFQRLAVMARLCRFEKNQAIFREGEDCPGVYVVGSGMVRVFKVGPGGREHVLHIVGPGGTFAEIAAIGGFQLPANAEAIEQSVCVLLPQEPLRRALEDDHDLCREMLTGLAMWFRHLIGLIEDIVLRDAAGRLARYFLKTPPNADGAIELPSLKRHVASHLNLTSETFSRTLRRLVEAGMVSEEDNARLRLVDRAALEAVAEGMFPKV